MATEDNPSRRRRQANIVVKQISLSSIVVGAALKTRISLRCVPYVDVCSSVVMGGRGLLRGSSGLLCGGDGLLGELQGP